MIPLVIRVAALSRDEYRNHTHIYVIRSFEAVYITLLSEKTVLSQCVYLKIRVHTNINVINFFQTSTHISNGKTPIKCTRLRVSPSYVKHGIVVVVSSENAIICTK